MSRTDYDGYRIRDRISYCLARVLVRGRNIPKQFVFLGRGREIQKLSTENKLLHWSRLTDSCWINKAWGGVKKVNSRPKVGGESLGWNGRTNSDLTYTCVKKTGYLSGKE